MEHAEPTTASETQRGCELYLFQPKKTGNFDCTFCMDCVQACPHDNVGIRAVIPGSSLGVGRLSKRLDVAALALILVFGAFVNAGAMVRPVMATWWFMALGLLVAPALVVWLGPGKEFALALIPLGFSMWIAHFSYHLPTGWRSIIPVAGRILRLPGSGFEMAMLIPTWWKPAEILLLDGGLLLTLYVAWRMARRHTLETNRALRLLMPWALLAILLYSAGIWILFQPMQMRGMVMN